MVFANLALSHLTTDARARSVVALSEALSEWGEEKGAIVVVSHDRNFCDKIQFTHVATVKDGTFKLEERGARASDWVIDGLSSAASGSGDDDETISAKAKAAVTVEMDPKLRKAAYNAPKRIKKLEDMVDQAERKMAELDEVMLANGKDASKLVDWNKEKQVLQRKVDGYMKEWNELEEILAQVAATTTA